MITNNELYKYWCLDKFSQLVQKEMLIYAWRPEKVLAWRVAKCNLIWIFFSFALLHFVIVIVEALARRTFNLKVDGSSLASAVVLFP